MKLPCLSYDLTQWKCQYGGFQTGNTGFGDILDLSLPVKSNNILSGFIG